MKRFAHIIFFASFSLLAYSQQVKNGVLGVMFYNTENLFDPEDDPHKNDNEFIPNGKNRWTYTRLYSKLNNLSQVIVATGKWEAPAIVGMCEVENERVLRMLVKNDILLKYNYQIVHFESPDIRGIDVAAIYRPDLIKLIDKRAIRISFPFDANKRTRDVLYFKVATLAKDSLHIFINHWPSKLGGAAESDELREYVASVLKSKVDSLLKHNKHSKIIIMGDFNDEPDSKSVNILASYKQSTKAIEYSSIYNLAIPVMQAGKGTHLYQNRWSVLDQIMVSGALLKSRTGTHTQMDHFRVVNDDFLFKINRRKNRIPLRTYAGPKYQGGYSDHLPVYLELNFEK